MSWVSGIAVYVLIWWVTLFAVLPIGTRPVSEGDPEGGWRGLPERPMVLRKAIATTVLAAALWLVFYMLAQSEWFSFRAGWLALPEK